MSISVSNCELTARAYSKKSMWVIAGITLLVLLVMSIRQDMQPLTSLLICVVYTCLTDMIFIAAWKTISKKSPQTLPKFYLAASALRLLIAATVALAVCLILKERQSVITFVILFSIYYIAMLIFDSVFFVRLLQNSNNKQQ